MSEKTLPKIYEWNGDFFAPVGRRFIDECNAEFVIGQRYRLALSEDASDSYRAQYFIQVKEMWQSLPDDKCARWPSPDLWRYYALIKTGFCVHTQIVGLDTFEALKIARCLTQDPYSIATVKGCFVDIWRAKSQKLLCNGGDMDAAEFKRSKEAVIEFLTRELGIDKADLPTKESA